MLLKNLTYHNLSFDRIFRLVFQRPNYVIIIMLDFYRMSPLGSINSFAAQRAYLSWNPAPSLFEDAPMIKSVTICHLKALKQIDKT